LSRNAFTSASLLAGDRQLVRHQHLRDRELVLFGVLLQLLHRRVRVLRLPFFGGV
jgi:hypothetical protein